MEEYKRYRCCLCPNSGKELYLCPPSPFGKSFSQCRYARIYYDDKGNAYKVTLSSSNGLYEVNMLKLDGEICNFSELEPTDQCDEMLKRLNAWAKEKKWLSDPIELKGLVIDNEDRKSEKVFLEDVEQALNWMIEKASSPGGSTLKSISIVDVFNDPVAMFEYGVPVYPQRLIEMLEKRGQS